MMSVIKMYYTRTILVDVSLLTLSIIVYGEQMRESIHIQYNVHRLHIANCYQATRYKT